MGRLVRPPEPEVVERQSDGAEADLWDCLRALGSRLSIGQANRFAVDVADEWIRLNSTGSPCSQNVQSLARFAVEHGARQRDVDGVIERSRKLTADGSWRAAQHRHYEMRRRLTDGV